MAQIHISSLMNQYQKDNAAEANFTELYGALGGSYQPLNSILTSISGLATNVTGLIKLTNGVASLDTNNYALASAIPTSINGLSGGSLTTPLVIKGGDGAGAAKIALDHTQAGQITDESTHTLFGFTTNGTTTLTIGHSSYAMALRGSGTRPTYNGNNLALYSDIPSVPTVNNGTLTIQKNGTNVQTFTANQSTNATANIVVNNGTLTIQQNGVQVTTFGADQSGNATANIETNNPNLLINPDFHINQRGSVSYSGNNNYTVDRWKIAGGNCVVTPQTNGTLLVHTTTTWNGICQILEDYSQLKGKTITLTIAGTFASSGVRIAIKSLVGSTQTDLATADGTNADSSISVSFNVPSNASYDYLFIAIYNKSSADSYLSWAKLEVGSVATTFSPPLMAEELLKCQRFYCKYIAREYSNYFGLGAAYYSTTRTFHPFKFRVKMRISPSFSYGGNWRLVNTNVGKTDISLSTDQTNTEGCAIAATSAGGGLTSGSILILGANNDTSAYIAFNAEI